MIVTIQFRRFKQRETTYNRVIAPKKTPKTFIGELIREREREIN